MHTSESRLDIYPNNPPFIGDGIPAHKYKQVERSAWLKIRDCVKNAGPWPMTLVGDPGTGKTCAALCMLDFVRARRYFTVASMCEEIVAVQNGEVDYGFKTDTPRQWWSRYRNYYECVVVDELGARERVSDFQYETVKRAIDERCNRPTVFISNHDLDQLSTVYDDRVASRLAGGTLIIFDGDDRRLSKGAKAGAA